MIVIVQQFDTDSSLEYQYDVRTAEKEVAHLLTLFKTVADMQRGEPIAGTDLRHAYRKHRNETKVFGFDDGTRTGLYHLEAHVIMVIVELLAFVPKGVAATGCHPWNSTQFA